MRLDGNKRICGLHCFTSEGDHIKKALCPFQQSFPDAYHLSHSPPSSYHPFCGHYDLKLPLCSGKTQPMIGVWRLCPRSASDGLRRYGCCPDRRSQQLPCCYMAALGMCPPAHRPVSARRLSRAFKAVDTGELTLLLFHRSKVK